MSKKRTYKFSSRQGDGPTYTYEYSDYSSSSNNDKPQDPPIKHDLFVTLEDISKGCTKKMKISRKILQADGLPRKESKILTINVKPGSKVGTEIVFKKEGDQGEDITPADIIFIIREKSHPIFKREGSDICYTAKISLKEALCGTTIDVPILSGYKIPLNLKKEIVTPATVKRIQGHGLPFPDKPGKKGDLLVSFDITFPDTQEQKVRDIIYNVLPD